MTDAEIIKALECCVSHKGIEACKSSCPFHEQELCIEDGDALLKHSLDLINRQKAEIDILIRKKETLRDEIAEQQEEIERLREKIKSLYNEMVRIALMTVETYEKHITNSEEK